MTNAYHCGNCPDHRSCSIHPAWPIEGLSQADQREIIAIRDFTSKRGCLSHPKTREVLRKEGAKQERERILDEIQHWFKEHDCWKSDHGNYWTPVPFPASNLMQFVESLHNKEQP